MPSNVYCPFCGVILLPDPYSDDPTSLQTRVRIGTQKYEASTPPMLLFVIPP